jgi:cell division protein FtsB
MRQQINLFQTVLIDKQESLQSRQVVLLLLGFVALLMLLSLFGYWQLHTANEQLTVLQQQKQQTEARVVALEQQYPELQKSVLLKEEIVRAKQTLVGQKKLLGYFSARDAEDNAGTLEILEGLARHRSTGVWLRRVQLDVAGNSIALAGSALRPEQVPQYLQSLGDKGVLGGQVFSRLSLARLQERPGQVDFNLESLAEGQ